MRLSEDGICLIKGPSKSGKTCLSELFQFYLSKFSPTEYDKIFYYNVCGVKTYENLLEMVKNDFPLNCEPIKDLIKEKKWLIIIDEAHNLYGETEFIKFWSLVAGIQESDLKKQVKFLFFAGYTEAWSTYSNKRHLWFSSLL